jgi:hypothetical protein|tara:strand:+ start:764 stop:943 length:180 start_codon:yes stop_codon:yes gene_type:complete
MSIKIGEKIIVPYPSLTLKLVPLLEYVYSYSEKAMLTPEVKFVSGAINDMVQIGELRTV